MIYLIYNGLSPNGKASDLKKGIMNSKIYDYSSDELQNLLNLSSGYSDVLRKMGMNPKGSNPDTLKKIIKEKNLDTSVMNYNRKNLYRKCASDTHGKTRYDLQDILNGKFPQYSSSRLLKRLVREGYKDEKCECCGITEWNGAKIIFQLHHKDGNRTNNAIENLKILCPNCHSQTENYCGKNKKMCVG